MQMEIKAADMEDILLAKDIQSKESCHRKLSFFQGASLEDNETSIPKPKKKILL